MQRRISSIYYVFFFIFVGCPASLPNSESLSFYCADVEDCETGQACVEHHCVAPVSAGQDANHAEAGFADAIQINLDAGLDDMAGRDHRYADQAIADQQSRDLQVRDLEFTDQNIRDQNNLDHSEHDAPYNDAGANDLGGNDASPNDSSAGDRSIDDAQIADQNIPDQSILDLTSSDQSSLDSQLADSGPGEQALPDLSPAMDAAATQDANTCIDNDGDNYGAGCAAGEDCDDDNPQTWRWLNGYIDADGDRFTVGEILPVCSGMQLPTGFTQSASALDDCDDNDVNVGSSVDTDGDGRPDCLDLDDDNDGLTDAEENSGSVTGYATNPLKPDTDDDGHDDAHDALPLEPLCSEILFADNFSSDPTSRWTELSGTWSWDSVNHLYSLTSVTEGAVSWIGNRNWDDYVVDAEIRPGANNNDSGLMFRASAASAQNNCGQYYYVGLYPNSNNVTLGYMTPKPNCRWNAVKTGSHTINSGTSYALRVILNGDDITVLVDGQEVLTHTANTYASGGIGLRSYRNIMSLNKLRVCQ